MLADETKGLKAILAEDVEIQVSEVQECFNNYGYHISRQEILSPVGIENKLESDDHDGEELVVVARDLNPLSGGDSDLLIQKEEFDSIIMLLHSRSYSSIGEELERFS